MGKTISFSAIILVFLVASTGLMEQGDAQAQRCQWECKLLPNFPCWLKGAGEGLCDNLCKYEGAISGVCVSDPHRCLCRNPKPGCS